ncbi:MAG TPA: Calx-beta domain-containing protein [Kofleriaceae bacterium]|nr:Calx-beta domain-containing protein [Kofleriaceae bacterium]
MTTYLRAGLVGMLVAAGCGDNIKADPDELGLLKVSKLGGLETTEAGGTDSFEVELIGMPRENILVKFKSTNTDEGTVDVVEYEFERHTWDKPVVITVKGVDDDYDDKDQLFEIDVDAGEFGHAHVPVANRDDDVFGAAVTATTGLQTSESGTTAQFTVKLTSKPYGNVTIPLSSNRPTEGSLTTAMLTFTPLDWNAAQIVTVTGVDDSVADDNQNYVVTLGSTTSSDARDAAIDPEDVSLINLDNDLANFLVTPTVGLQTTESQGTATFTVQLLSQPSANVTFDVASDTPSEGTASPATLTFTPLNWNAPQQVTITGANDDVADGNKPYTIVLNNVVSSDAQYVLRDPSDVAVTNLDNDTAGVSVSLATTAETTESGGTADFDVVLLSQPLTPVTFAVSSGNATEGTASVTSLTFTDTNWNAPQRVTVTGQNDNVADGDQHYAIVLDPDASYVDVNNQPVDPDDVSLINRDNDTAGVQLSRTTGLVTDETGLSDVFTVVLLSQPVDDVTISYMSSNTAEAIVSPLSPITFTPANWDAPQTISAKGVDDVVRDGNQQFQILITTASTDANYDNVPVPNVFGVNLDDDAAAIRVTPTELEVSEFGDSDTFDVVLVAQPTASVTIPITSSDTTEGTVDKSSLTFTTANWNVPQTVTVTGVNDALIDGQQQFFIRTGAVVSTDPFYVGVDADDVTVLNFDDESPGVYVQAHNLLKTQEGTNQPQHIRMRLTLAPTAPVTCVVTVSDPTEIALTPSPSVFTFDATNFSVLQTFDVRGVDDAIVDGDQLVTVITQPCTSADPVYNLFDPRNIRVLNRDNE